MTNFDNKISNDINGCRKYNINFETSSKDIYNKCLDYVEKCFNEDNLKIGLPLYTYGVLNDGRMFVGFYGVIDRIEQINDEVVHVFDDEGGEVVVNETVWLSLGDAFYACVEYINKNNINCDITVY